MEVQGKGVVLLASIMCGTPPQQTGMEYLNAQRDSATKFLSLWHFALDRGEPGRSATSSAGAFSSGLPAHDIRGNYQSHPYIVGIC